MPYSLNKYTIPLLLTIGTTLSTSCNGTKYNCICTHPENGKQVATYEFITSDKSSAIFDCRQKELQFTGPEMEGTKCTIKELN